MGVTDPKASLPTTIGMLLYPGCTQLDLTSPYEVFASMSDSQVYLIAASKGPAKDPVPTERGLAICPNKTLADAPQTLDVLFVPGGPGVTAMMEDDDVITFLKDRAARARYITAVCTGALLLGVAGLLKGYRATTHWASLDLLDLSPGLGATRSTVHERVAKDRTRITGGGVTAGIDFALSVVEELRGKEEACRIQLEIEYDPDPPFASGSPWKADPELVKQVRADFQDAHEKRRRLIERMAPTL